MTGLRRFLPLALLGLFIAVSIACRMFRTHADPGKITGSLERAWSSGDLIRPRRSKFISFDYKESSGLYGYADSERWPGSLDRGIATQVLNDSITLAQEKYGIQINKVNINGPVDPSAVNIYFIDPSSSESLQPLQNQCVYLGVNNIIVCDSQYLFQFVKIPLIELELESYLADGQHFSSLLDTQRTFRVHFLLRDLAAAHHTILWAILHEIGHIVYGHQPISRWDRIRAPTASRKRALRMELEADSFATEVLDKSEALYPIYTGLSAIAFGEIARALKSPDGNLSVRPEELNDDIPVRRSYGDHPPMLVRVLDALVRLEESNELDFANPDNPLFTRLRSKVVMVP